MMYRAVLPIALSLSLAACGQSAPTRFLTLDPVPAASGPVDYRGPSVRVPSVRIPPALDRDEFVQKGAPGELKVDDFVRWSAPFGMLARNTLIIDLAARLPAGAVAPPDAPARPAGRRIDVSIVSLEIAGGEATLQAAYEIAPDADQAAPSRRQWMTLRLPSGPSALEAARAYSALLGQLSDRIAADLASQASVR